MLRVVCRFHDADGNVTYLRSDEERTDGMVDTFDANGGRNIHVMGNHQEAVDKFTELAGDFLEGDQYDRFMAHVDAGAQRNQTPQDENREPTPQEDVEDRIEEGEIED